MAAVAGFDWDDGNRQKCQKHGVSIAEVEALLLSDEARIAPDLKHSDFEDNCRRPKQCRAADVCRIHVPPTRWSAAYSSRQRTIHAPERGRAI
jgi:hypothetical protein